MDVHYQRRKLTKEEEQRFKKEYFDTGGGVSYASHLLSLCLGSAGCGLVGAFAAFTFFGVLYGMASRISWREFWIQAMGYGAIGAFILIFLPMVIIHIQEYRKGVAAKKGKLTALALPFDVWEINAGRVARLQSDDEDVGDLFVIETGNEKTLVLEDFHLPDDSLSPPTKFVLFKDTCSKDIIWIKQLGEEVEPSVTYLREDNMDHEFQDACFVNVSFDTIQEKLR